MDEDVTGEDVTGKDAAAADLPVREDRVDVAGDGDATASLELFIASEQSTPEVATAGAPTICAAHPAEAYTAESAHLLSRLAGTPVVCVNSRGLGGSSGELGSMASMARDLDRVRRHLGLERWCLWGISGGGWLAQLYARHFRDATRGMILESACACYRQRAADPDCLMSPANPAWRTALEDQGIHAEPPKTGPVPEGSTWRTVEGVGHVLVSGEAALLVLPEGMPATPLVQRAHRRFLDFDARPWLAELDVPTLTLGSTEDPVAPFAYVRSLHAGLPSSTLLTLEGASHVPTLQGVKRARQAVREFVAGL
ncbi:MAG: alpha/beta hydrolase [Acidobacteriota bacterium]